MIQEDKGLARKVQFPPTFWDGFKSPCNADNLPVFPRSVSSPRYQNLTVLMTSQWISENRTGYLLEYGNDHGPIM